MNGRIIAFCCEHSAYPAADLAGRLRLSYSGDVRIIRVPCAGQVDVIHMLKALEKGAGAVLVVGCEDGACHHITGNTRAEERVRHCHTLLDEARIAGDRVAMYNISPNAPHRFVRVADEMVKTMEQTREAR